MFLVCVLLQLAFTSVSAAVSFQDCGSIYEIKSIDIEGCTSRPPCYITLGDIVKVTLRFYARNHFMARNLGQNVVIDINRLHVLPTVTPERCDIRHCPAWNTGIYTSFNSTLTVPTRMVLNQRGYLRWRIMNEEGRLILCYSVMVQTQSRVHKRIRQFQGIIPLAQNVKPNETIIKSDTESK